MPSGSGDQTSTSYQTNLPAYAEPYFLRMMARSEAASNQGYQAYPGQRLADFNSTQTQAGTSTAQIAPQAYNDMGGVISGYQNSAGYNPTGMNATSWSGAQAANYMDPYAQNVTNLAIEDSQRKFQAGQAQADQQAGMQGAFGGSRQGLNTQQRQYDQGKLEAGIRTQGQSDAYRAGMSQFNQDQQRSMAAQQSNIAESQFKTNSDAAKAQQLVNMDTARQTAGLQGAKALMDVGNQQQSLTQKSLDIGYQDFVNQRDYDKQQLSFYNSMLRGTPVQANSDIYSSVPSNSLAQAAGAGISGLGLYNQLMKT